MGTVLSSSQRAASALRKAERALRNWQDDIDSPRADVDRMLAIMNDLSQWVQGHVLSDIERAEDALRSRRSNPAV
ncbi:MAG TPA: hypothetical protein VKT77_16415 [Chthonomonadaceae bacterium]|nr:hypothetical protein [Chthonomonadaceae bacterium]